MRKSRSQCWSAGAAFAGLLFVAASGCQMGPTPSTAAAKSEVSSMPQPFYPKEWVHLFPSKPEVEYSFTEEAQTARLANARSAANAAGVGQVAATGGAK
jgi:hypothetical protein